MKERGRDRKRKGGRERERQNERKEGEIRVMGGARDGERGRND